MKDDRQPLDAAVAPLDHESRAEDDHHVALRLWLRLLTCTHLVEQQVRRRLRAEFDSTLPRFDLLAQLERHRAGLKMSELSRRLMVTGGNVTGLADQLEAEGWLVREPVANDRRATRLKLTRDGSRRFDAMAREHERWVIEALGGLSRAEQARLLELLGRLKSGLAASGPATARSDRRRALSPEESP
ncbi:MAG: MarR family transcriptional regulator [Burkholderiales bacterium]|nr:MAG: MarR family transcriptional regulator [Burkholderiales bacterium]